MTCPCDNTKRRMPKCDAGTPPVLEIDGGETPVLFHTVNIPASVGDDTTIPPTPGAYRNTRVTYEANNASYLYDSDGIPQILATSEVSVLSVNGQTGNVVLTAADVGAQEKLTAGTSITISPQNVISAPPVDTVLDKTSPNPISNSAVATAIDTITTELDRTVVYDLEMASDANSVTFTEDKIDVVTGATSQEIDVIPTASADTAGTITAAEFRSITASQERLDALENGSVAIADLPASPTQQELTTAWLNATDREELINRASIYDITNSKVWTYYTNILLWEETPAGAISVNPFTNNTAGTILGSTTDGAISANVDGTGSVSGWSALKQTVSEKANSADLATVATTGAYSDLIGAPSLATVATSGDYDDLINKPTIGNATLTIQKNGTDVQTFTANATSDVTANISVPTDLSELSGKVTASQIDEEAITTDTISGSGTDISLNGTMDGAAIEDVKLKGDTQQQTYSGAQLLKGAGMATPTTDTSFWASVSSNVSLSPQSDNYARITQTDAGYGNFQPKTDAILNLAVSTTYTLLIELENVSGSGSLAFVQPNQAADIFSTFTIVAGASTSTSGIARTELSSPDAVSVLKVTTKSSFDVSAVGLRFYTGNVPTNSHFDIRVTILAGDHSSDWQNYAGDNYQPYVGGTASPNPDYPQEVQTVTGEQTITINDGDSQSQTYTVDLGSIELCKIGDYQDYIYKSGEDWYLHKETGKLLADVANGYIGAGDNYTNISYFVFDMSPDAKYYNQYSNNLDYDCTHATPKTHQSGSSWDTTAFVGGISMDAAATRYWLGFKKGTTLADMKTALSGMLVYYPLATATDTQITNATLIAQLNAVKGLTTYDGQTNINVSGDLPAILDVTTAADSKLAPNSVYSSAIRDGAVTVDKIASLQALADALAPYLSNQ